MQLLELTTELDYLTKGASHDVELAGERLLSRSGISRPQNPHEPSLSHQQHQPTKYASIAGGEGGAAGRLGKLTCKGCAKVDQCVCGLVCVSLSLSLRTLSSYHTGITRFLPAFSRLPLSSGPPQVSRTYGCKAKVHVTIPTVEAIGRSCD